MEKELEEVEAEATANPSETLSAKSAREERRAIKEKALAKSKEAEEAAALSRG